MKKLLSILLSVSMFSMAFVGCSSDTTTNTTSTENTTNTETTNDEATNTDITSAEVLSGEVQEIKDRGILRVGVKNNVLGFGFQDPLTSEYTGLEIEIAKKLATELGVDIEFTSVTAATRSQLIDSGDLDCVIATFTITDERKENWDFSTPYYTDHVTVLVENSSGITDVSGLIDKKVGVSSGSNSARSLVQEMIDNNLIDGANFSIDTFDANTWTTGVSFQQYDDYPTISTALTAGEIDAFCVDKSILAVYNTDSRSYIENEFAPQDYGVVTKKGSEFSTFVEEKVSTWLNDGTIATLVTENGLE